MTTDPTPPTDHDAVTLADELLTVFERVAWRDPHDGIMAQRVVLDALQSPARLAARDAVPATAQGPGVAEVLLRELNSEDAQAVLYGVTGTHPGDYGGVTKDEALECAGELLTRLRALAAAGQPTTQPAPEATTMTEWRVRMLDGNGWTDVAPSRAAADLLLLHGGWQIEAQRTRTTYADHVTDWVPVVSEEASRG